MDCLVRDITLQNIVDWLIPDFKHRDDKLKSQLLHEAHVRRVNKGKLDAKILQKGKSFAEDKDEEMQDSQSEKGGKKSKKKVKPGSGGISATNNDINFEFKLVPFQDEDVYLRMKELPKTLKFANKHKPILTVKKHIHNYLGDPIDNIEILCKNFPVADSHTLDFIKKTKWQNAARCLILMYRRKKRLVGNAAANQAKEGDEDQEMALGDI